jgi:hypothetical protein
MGYLYSTGYQAHIVGTLSDRCFSLLKCWDIYSWEQRSTNKCYQDSAIYVLTGVLNYLGLNHLGSNHLGLNHLGSNHLGLNHLG